MRVLLRVTGTYGPMHTWHDSRRQYTGDVSEVAFVSRSKVSVQRHASIPALRQPVMLPSHTVRESMPLIHLKTTQDVAEGSVVCIIVAGGTLFEQDYSQRVEWSALQRWQCPYDRWYVHLPRPTDHYNIGDMIMYLHDAIERIMQGDTTKRVALVGTQTSAYVRLLYMQAMPVRCAYCNCNVTNYAGTIIPNRRCECSARYEPWCAHRDSCTLRGSVTKRNERADRVLRRRAKAHATCRYASRMHGHFRYIVCSVCQIYRWPNNYITSCHLWV